MRTTETSFDVLEEMEICIEFVNGGPVAGTDNTKLLSVF